MFVVSFRVTGLSSHLVADKLARAGIAVLRLTRVEKNTVEVRIRAKDRKKAFAILPRSCYNITEIRTHGLACAAQTAARSAGLLLGGVVAAALVLFAESRVLAVRVEGSGAYYEREVRAILKEEHADLFSPMPRDTARLAARVLALPRVEFCAFRREGGVLTVEVQTVQNIQPIAGMPLVSEVDGILEELIVVRGTPLLREGDEVHAGDVLVKDSAVIGGREVPSLVIASAVVSHPVSAEYAASSAEAALSMAALEYGELTQSHTYEIQTGWRVEGVAHTTFSLNLG